MNTGPFWRLPSAAMSLALATAVLIPASSAAQPEPVQADVVDNIPTTALGGEATLRAEDATITRYEDRLVFEVRMDTPDPGTYIYPPEVPDERKAPPEVFTAWAFVFNYPEHCVGSVDSDLCFVDDFSDDVQAGIYGVAGHASSLDHEGRSFILDRGTDGQIVLRGEIAVGDPQVPEMPPGETTYPLSNPLGAEVHFAIAPHGQLDPATMASELYQPAGNPGCDCWWVSFFVPSEDDG